MKLRTRTFLLLLSIVCITYFWDISKMFSSIGGPPIHSSSKKLRSNKVQPAKSSKPEIPLGPRGPTRKTRELASARNDSWKPPIWPPKAIEDDGVQTVQLTEEKTNTDLSVVLPADNQANIQAPIDTTRYLLPITLGNQGPNNQLQSFKFCLAVALIHNYTLVLPPFFEHQIDTLMLPKQRTFQETIDWRTLETVIPVVSVEGFKTACYGKADTVIIGTAYGKGQTSDERLELEEYEDRMAKSFGKITGIKIPSILNDAQHILDLPDGTPGHFIHIEDYIRKFPAAFNSSSRCNVFVHPYGMLGRFGYRHYNPFFSQYFLRADYIRTVADKFITQYLGKRFLCLHWRFDKNWVQFWCNQFYQHGRYYCPILMNTPVTEVTRRISLVLQQYQLNVVYYASPIDQREDQVLQNLRESIQYLFTRANILSSSLAEKVWFQGDNYRLSLLEQEICKRSEFFIASELSSWSDMVIEDRQGASVQRVTDILR